jgi:hypothetical protein
MARLLTLEWVEWLGCQLEEAHEAIEGTAHAPRIRGVA